MNLKVMAAVLALFTTPHIASAGIFEDVWGVVTDPLKLRSGSKVLSSTVDRSISALEILQNELDTDVRFYISELQEVLKLAGTTISDAKLAALEVERKVYEDARLLLSEAECALERFSKGTLPESLEAVLRQLAESSITVDLPFGKSLELALGVAKATSPDIAYIEVRDGYLRALDQVSDETSAYFIVSSYQNIAELAFKTHCHYVKSKGSVLFLREFSDYSAKLRPWLNVVSVEVQK